MSFNLVMNSNNVVSGSNNSRYSYTFINNNLAILDEAEIAISNITMPYSWFNITTAYNNTTFNIIWPIGSTASQTFPVIIPDGFYTITQMNEYVQQLSILLGLYLIDNNGNYVYYTTFLYNPTTYGVQLITSLVPTSLPAGWTQPSNWYGFPTVSRTPQVQLLSTSNFYQLIGFVNNTNYPTIADFVDRSFISTSVPLGSYVNSLIIRCNLVNNSVGFPSDIIDTMPITSTFGSNLNYSPYALKWVKLSGGTYQKLEIQFVDQNLNSIPILDNNVCISLLINNKGNPIVETFIEKELPKLTFRN